MIPAVTAPADPRTPTAAGTARAGALSRVDGVLALACAAALTGLHFFLLSSGHTRPMGDDASLFLTTACLYRELAVQGPVVFHTCVEGAPYPPLVTFLATVHHWLAGGPSVASAIASLWPFHALLGLGLFLGVRRDHGRLAGLAAAVLAPVVISETAVGRAFFTEVPLAALAVCSVALLAACEGFRRPWRAAALGAFLGAGLLVKWTFAFLLAPPMVLAFVLALWRCTARWPLSVASVLLAGGAFAALMARLSQGWEPGFAVALALLGALAVGLALTGWRRRAWLGTDAGLRLLGLVACTLAVLAVAGPWYLSSEAVLQEFLGDNLSGGYDGDPMTLAETWFFYPTVVLVWVQAPLLILAAAGAVRCLLPGRGAMAIWSLAVFVSSLVILALLPYRVSRYLMPALVLLIPLAIQALGGWGRLSQGAFLLVLAFAVVFQSGTVDPQMQRLHRGPEPVYGLAGSDHHGIETTRDYLERMTFRFRLFATVAPTGGPAAEALGRAIVERTGPEGRAVVMLLDARSEITNLDLRVGLGARRNTQEVRIVEEDLQGDLDRLPETVRRHFPQCRFRGSSWPLELFIVEGRRHEPMPGETRTPSLGPQLEQRGFETIYEEGTDTMRGSWLRLWQGERLLRGCI